jgi:hypothetical protein
MKKKETNMSNGSSVKSVSLADGTLSPDLRVNYTFGFVLGVNEFQQEQEYLLQKAYLYNRAFHGYGTISGLHVTAKWLKGEEVEVTVSPGMAIDQFGIPIAVRDAQCARLTAWLKKQEAQKQGTIAEHRRDKGDDEGRKRHLRVYIIARYDDYPDGQVPIAGQACNSGDTEPISSRIRDSYTIDFSWDPPALPAWDSMRCFGKIMAQVRIKTHVEVDDTDEIIEQIRKLVNPNNIPLCTSPGGTKQHHHDNGPKKCDDWDDEEREPRWYIPAATARESLDRIFMTWVTEVRPNLLPNLLDPTLSGTDAKPDILLAHIDFTLDDDWHDDNPKIEEHGYDQPDNRGRPFLLSTQAMQELLLLGHQELQRVGRGGDDLPEHEFATIQVRNNHTLYAWIHHPRRLQLEADNEDWGKALEVRSDGLPLRITHVLEYEPNVFEIHVKAEENEGSEGPLMVPGARVELIFKVDEIDVECMDDESNEKDETVVEEIAEGVKHVAEDVKKDVEKTEDAIQQIGGDIVKATGKVIEDFGKGVQATSRALQRVLGIGKDTQKFGAKVKQTGKKIEKEGQGLIASALADEKRLDQEEKEEYESLGRSIRELGLNYIEYDRDEKTIVVYTIASHIPVSELVTFFIYDHQSDAADVPYSELKKVTSAEHFLALWFHTDDPVRLPSEVRVRRMFVNQQPQEMLFRAIAPEKQTFSWFWALQPPDGVRLVPGELLTVIFNTNKIAVGYEESATVSLTEVMREEPFTCVGYDGNHTLEVYHQVSLVSRQYEKEEESSPTGKLSDNQHSAKTNNSLGPTSPFVTVTITRLSQGTKGAIEAHLELWFHLSTNPDDNRTGFTENLIFDAFLEDGQQMKTTQIAVTSPTRVQPNIYTSMLTLPAPSKEQRGYYLRLHFRLDANPVNVRGVKTFHQTLEDYIRSTGIRFEGYNGEDAILAYVRIAAPILNTK